VRGAGAVTFSGVRLALPTAVPAPSLLPGARRCKSRRRFTIRVKRPAHARLRSAKVWVTGKRVKVRRRQGRLTAVVDLRGMTRRRVADRIVARTRSDRVLRDRRVYRLCAGSPA
jgi:ABC-2 type transport system ATP-binding protein